MLGENAQCVGTNRGRPLWPEVGRNSVHALVGRCSRWCVVCARVGRGFLPVVCLSREFSFFCDHESMRMTRLASFFPFVVSVEPLRRSSGIELAGCSQAVHPRTGESNSLLLSNTVSVIFFFAERSSRVM